MMKISIPKEIYPGETRAPLTPASVAKLTKLGATVEVESGIGAGAGFSDDDYVKTGATIAHDRKNLLNSADMVLRFLPGI